MRQLIVLMSDMESYSLDKLSELMQLSADDVLILLDAVKQQGIGIVQPSPELYQLADPVSLLDADKISLACEKVITNIEVVECIGSTNHRLLEKIKQDQGIQACIAEQQTQGKGRFNRSWHSPYAQNIYLSIAYPISAAAATQHLSVASLVVGIAVRRALLPFVSSSSAELQLKWPNDLMMQGKKLAGVLIETKRMQSGAVCLVIGIGVNVNMPMSQGRFIDQPWISLRHVVQQHCDRNDVCIALIKTVTEAMQCYLCDGWLAFQEEWRQADFLCGKSIKTGSSQSSCEGVCIGVDQQGFLLLQDSSGTVSRCSSGEITLLK